MTHVAIFTHHIKTPAQSGVPDWRLVKAKGDNYAATSGFLLSKYQHIYQWWAGCGASKEAPGSFCSGTPICDQLTTRMIGVFCGGITTLQKEIASMAINAHSRLKTFFFAAVERANLKSSCRVMLHITAATERLARQSASRQYVLSFAGVIQNRETL
ncbi:host cell division inhibitor Icd-like protein [Citrobacter freundii]|uniref:host cell division inhibitor Icd-like protein n=1 Tax=Citrobacter freundii TaxID=546 RepID=UPI00186B7194|nr:host cell division inhibitor Icd-like protein [Citrobacter freundii]MBE4700993.1 host cell division inhibitor Icd-like protein [Citrobacter freundii]